MTAMKDSVRQQKQMAEIGLRQKREVYKKTTKGQLEELKVSFN